MDHDRKYHEHCRDVAASLVSPDKKQLRFNEIVEAAKLFYPMNIVGGCTELVLSCDRDNDDLYIPKQPMWKSLRDYYSWMIVDV